jgi:7-keto-8-aminopelargonate synthetase-like enzyme
MMEQAKYEFESQEIMRAKKTAAANKTMKAALRQAKQRQARRDLNSTWTAGMPRTRVVVLKAQSPVVGLKLTDRDSCELLAGEFFEQGGQLTSFSKAGHKKRYIRTRVRNNRSVMFPLSALYHVYTPHKQRGTTRIDFGPDLV